MLPDQKKGVSVIIGYVLLIVFAMVISVGVYAWLKTYVPNEPLNCPDGVSLFVKDASFNSSTSLLNITARNNGRFDVAGYFIAATNNSSQKLPSIDLSNYLNEDSNGIKFGSSVLFSVTGSNSLKPGDEKTNSFTIPLSVGNISTVRVIPTRFQEEENRERFVSCGDARVQQTVGASSGGGACVPNCSGGKVCGSDGCGGVCPPNNCGTGSCNSTGQCVAGVVCGDGNTGGTEQCDNGASNGACPATCSSSCTLNNCGGGGISGLVAYYPFDEGSGTNVNDGAGSNNGTINGATWTTSGKYGNALTFDGNNDYVSLGNNSALTPSNQVTFASWIKLAAVTGTPQMIIGKYNTSGAYPYQLRIQGGDKVRFSVRTSSSEDVDTSNILSANQWIHVAGTWDGTIMRIYINGTAVPQTDSKTGTMPNTAVDVRIGSSSSGSFVFNGQIDEVRIYNRALTGPEVMTLFNATSPP